MTASTTESTTELLEAAAKAIEEIANLLIESGSAEGNCAYERQLAARLRAAAERERWHDAASDPPDDEITVFASDPDGETTTAYKIGDEWYVAGCIVDVGRPLIVTRWRHLPEATR